MRRVLTALILVVGLAAVGCAARSASIAEIQSNPGRYHDRSVSVQGTVTSSWGAPFVPFRMYKVTDGSGELTVVSRGRLSPTRGARVRVKGRVNEVAVFGGRAVGLHLQEEDLDVKRR